MNKRGIFGIIKLIGIIFVIILIVFLVKHNWDVTAAFNDLFSLFRIKKEV